MKFTVRPTWDAHHYYIERRAEITDESWAKLLADPDWNDHAREELLAGRVCDGCLITVARGRGTGGRIGFGSTRLGQTEAQEELKRRGVPWTYGDEGAGE